MPTAATRCAYTTTVQKYGCEPRSGLVNCTLRPSRDAALASRGPLDKPCAGSHTRAAGRALPAPSSCAMAAQETPDWSHAWVLRGLHDLRSRRLYMVLTIDCLARWLMPGNHGTIGRRNSGSSCAARDSDQTKVSAAHKPSNKRGSRTVAAATAFAAAAAARADTCLTSKGN